MTAYEILRKSLERFLLPLHWQVAVALKRIVAEKSRGTEKVTVLDAGGRKSPYTIGLNADVSILDLPRETYVQEDLNLGINEKIVESTTGNRSNISEIRFGDMTNSPYDDESFDVIVSVEVLEHVDEDSKFVSEVARVLKDDGVFLMTTPNGDWVPNTNPDHRRHYRREQLEQILKVHFDDVDVYYGVIESRCRKWGIKSWSPRRPITTFKSMIGNFVNGIESGQPAVRNDAMRTHHLIAECRSPKRNSI